MARANSIKISIYRSYCSSEREINAPFGALSPDFTVLFTGAARRARTKIASSPSRNRSFNQFGGYFAGDALSSSLVLSLLLSGLRHLNKLTDYRRLTAETKHANPVYFYSLSLSLSRRFARSLREKLIKRRVKGYKLNASNDPVTNARARGSR